MALIIICMAIAGGALTAYARLADKNTPIDTGLLHGRLGVAGVAILAYIGITGDTLTSSVKPALFVFILTIIGGVTLYYIIRRKGILPVSIIFAHGLLAITGLLTLIYNWS
jgi:hypothetical protein